MSKASHDMIPLKTMRYYKNCSFILAALICFGGLSAHAAAPKAGADASVSGGSSVKNRIVVQVNEDGARKWNDILVNIHNIQVEMGAKNIAIAVVAIGPGLGMLKADSLAANGVQEALATGVEFVACGNSMRAQKLTKEDFVDGVTVSIAGYVEIMQRQQQGWAYLRP